MEGLFLSEVHNILDMQMGQVPKFDSAVCLNPESRKSYQTQDTTAENACDKNLRGPTQQAMVPTTHS